MRRSPVRRNMPTFRYGGVFLTAIVMAVAGPVQGADLGAAPFTKAPPVVASSWTAFYAGVGLGFRSTQADLTTTTVLLDGVPFGLGGSGVTQPLDGVGFRANPYAGFNWQVAPSWVLGLEGDVGLGDHTAALAGYLSSPAFGSSTFAADSLSVKAGWDAGLRGRVGYLLTPTTLLYAAAGIAWQHYDVTSVCASAGRCTPAVVTNSTTRTGWTLGGGIETALWGHWLVRAEYRYADFGTAPFTITRTAATGPALTVDNFDAKFRTHTASVGVAYKFGDAIIGGRAHPLQAQAAVLPSWSGAYVGLGLGARATPTDLTATSESKSNAAFDLARRANNRPFDNTAFRASPYIGYLWQFAPQWTAGLEGDVGFADRTTTRDGFTNISLADSQSLGESTAIRSRWDASLRARLGYLVSPHTLLYATGGVAWQNFELTSTCVSSACGFLALSPAVLSASTTRAGWTAGGGIETALFGHWLARAEYRFADYGGSSFTVARSSSRPAFNPTVNTYDVTIRTHQASFGLTYRFE